VKRGELYLVRKPGSHDPRKQRVFAIVSRQALIDTRFSTVICAPIYSRHDGLSTQVQIGPAEGLKTVSSIHCDELVSLQKSVLTHYVGSLKPATLRELDRSLAIALALDESLFV
jgi:mRNA interferase MazF